MARFVQAKGYKHFINADKVKGFYQRKDNCIVVEYCDEEIEAISFNECHAPNYATDKFMNELEGSAYIKQVIPVTQPMYAVYNNCGDSKGQCIEPIYHIVLTADGIVKGAVLTNGYFEVVEGGIGDCEGLYYEHELSQFNIVNNPVGDETP